MSTELYSICSTALFKYEKCKIYCAYYNKLYAAISIDKLAIQLTTPLLLRKLCKLFASVARVVSDSWPFLLIFAVLYRLHNIK